MSMYLELVQLNPTINKLCDIVSSAVRANPSSISDEKRRGLPSQNTEGQTQLWAVERVTAIKKKDVRTWHGKKHETAGLIAKH